MSELVPAEEHGHIRRTFAVLSVMALLLLPACGGDETNGGAGPEATTTETDTTGPVSPSPTPTDAPGTPLMWPTTAVVVPHTGSVPPVPTLVDVRVGAHPEGGCDRVAFEFEGLPGYSVGYQPEIAYDGLGEPVDLDGEAFIQLVFNPAQAHDDGNSTLPAPLVEPVDVDFAALTAYVLNGDFEGYVSVALGLTQKVGFNVEQHEVAGGHYVVYIDVARP
ncbi:MAG: AMIN-like domain-containing (lipo)protein [Jiangellaceae bacterium]